MKLTRRENESDQEWYHRQLMANLRATTRNLKLALVFLSLSVVFLIIAMVLKFIRHTQ